MKKLVKMLAFLWLCAAVTACDPACPTAKVDAAGSAYLPLATGNTWRYRRTVSRPVLSYEVYTDLAANKVQFIVGAPPDIPLGVSQETYRVSGPFEGKPAQWEIEVSDPLARDGRYGGFYTHPDQIVWGRVVSAEEVVELDEVLSVTGGYFIGPQEQSAPLVIDPVLHELEVTLSSAPERMLYTAKAGKTAVSVAAGDFDCVLEVDTQVLDAEWGFTTKSYYAAGVGLVQEAQYNQAGQLTYALELVAYTLNEP